jgi:putative acetyltransferase
MSTANENIRPLRQAEEAEVDALLRAAFPGPEEAGLVRDLRNAGDMVDELALPWRGRIGAYAAVSRMVAPENWFCLAPVAVWPDLQRGAGAEGEAVHLGSRLVRGIVETYSSKEMLGARGCPKGDGPVTLVVLGKPSFYSRAGFSHRRAARLNSPYPVASTLILRPGDDLPSETLVYPQAFASV